ncbi:MAG: hypothetical protein A2857_06495 [Candidatus Levybacteria bacterium RIFCSPHIGHO2_01_FULL_36_15]|nr:MAG: hypothetical protein A2857_06495 [Candidatus Levybacteria bacterium RIFCSPHIGHO2_01_FULL_36_15]
MKLFNKQLREGFTLVELLVVIAVLGILATVILVAVDPLEQFARGRDASRKTVVGQLGRALSAYYTSQSATYPVQSATWMNTIGPAPAGSGDIRTIPVNPNYAAGGPNCAAAAANQNNFCYVMNGANPPDAIVYLRLESRNEYAKCTNPATMTPFFVWSSTDGRAGLVCTILPAAPGVGAQTWNAKQ